MAEPSEGTDRRAGGLAGLAGRAGTVARIAASVFRESVRDKVLYNLVLFAILLIAASLLLSQLTAGQELKIIKDLGLAAMSLFGLFIAVFIGIGLVSKEVERRTIYSLLAKPIRRTELVAGKYLGLILTLGVNLSVMAVALYGVLGYLWLSESEAFRASWEAPAMDPALLKAMYLIFLELCLVTAVALLLSTFSTPILSAAVTFGVYVAGHFSRDLLELERMIDAPLAALLARSAYYVLPNLATFDVKAEVVHAQPVSAGYLLAATAYAATYIAALLAGAMGIFARRDFK